VTLVLAAEVASAEALVVEAGVVVVTAGTVAIVEVVAVVVTEEVADAVVVKAKRGSGFL